MGRIKKRTSVNGIVPAEMVSASMKDQDPAVALYNALSIKVKPEEETPEQREARRLRRQFIFSMFGTSADELEEYLKKNKELQENKGPAKSELDILRDSEAVAAGQEASDKADKVAGFVDTGAKILKGAGTIVTTTAPFAEAGVFGAAAAEAAAVAGTVALGAITLPLTAVIGAGALALGIVTGVVVKLIRGNKAKKVKADDRNEKNKKRDEALELFIKKVGIINEILTQKSDEIMEKKKTMKPEEFAQYKKVLIEEMLQHMKSIGLEIATKEIKVEVEQEIEDVEDSKKGKKNKKLESKKEDDKKGPEKKEPEDPEKGENAEERGAE